MKDQSLGMFAMAAGEAMMATMSGDSSKLEGFLATVGLSEDEFMMVAGALQLLQILAQKKLVDERVVGMAFLSVKVKDVLVTAE